MRFWWLNPFDRRFGSAGGALAVIYFFAFMGMIAPPFLWLMSLWWKFWLYPQF